MTDIYFSTPSFIPEPVTTFLEISKKTGLTLEIFNVYSENRLMETARPLQTAYSSSIKGCD